MAAKLLNKGDVIELHEGHTVYADVPKHFVFENQSGNFELVNHEATIGGQFSYLAGCYIVIRTELTGGGGVANDWYPDGHLVTCERASDKVTVSFYQTGCFTATIKKEDIAVIGRAKKEWVFE
jgi:hypothetical protein